MSSNGSCNKSANKSTCQLIGVDIVHIQQLLSVDFVKLIRQLLSVGYVKLIRQLLSDCN